MRPALSDSINRRDFLRASVSCAGGAALSGSLVATAQDEYGGFKMGIQSYSLRGFDTRTALKHSQSLGLRYWEAYDEHFRLNSSPRQIREHKALLAAHGISLIAYGVVGFDASETAARRTFDFARAMGITSISANPKKNDATFDLLEQLVDEYDIRIAIHNHGPGALYDTISDVEDVVRGRHPKIGACVDTGHYIRSDEDAIEAIERLGDRVFGVHLKDVRTIESGENREKHFTILGRGDLDVPGCLQALRQLDYRHSLSLEYEENPEDPLADIAACLQAVRAAVQEIT